jgi:hypothetical protein
VLTPATTKSPAASAKTGTARPGTTCKSPGSPAWRVVGAAAVRVASSGRAVGAHSARAGRNAARPTGSRCPAGSPSARRRARDAPRRGTFRSRSRRAASSRVRWTVGPRRPLSAQHDGLTHALVVSNSITARQSARSQRRACSRPTLAPRALAGSDRGARDRLRQRREARLVAAGERAQGERRGGAPIPTSPRAGRDVTARRPTRPQQSKCKRVASPTGGASASSRAAREQHGIVEPERVVSGRFAARRIARAELRERRRRAEQRGSPGAAARSSRSTSTPGVRRVAPAGRRTARARARCAAPQRGSSRAARRARRARA